MITSLNINSHTVSSGLPGATLKSNLSESAQPAFPDAMRAASKASSESSGRSEARPIVTRRQRTAPDLTRALGVASVSCAGSRQDAHQHVVIAREQELKQQPPLGLSTASAIHLSDAGGEESQDVSVIACNSTPSVNTGLGMPECEVSSFRSACVVVAGTLQSQIKWINGQANTASVPPHSIWQGIGDVKASCKNADEPTSDVGSPVSSSTTKELPSNQVTNTDAGVVQTTALDNSLGTSVTGKPDAKTLHQALSSSTALADLAMQGGKSHGSKDLPDLVASGGRNVAAIIPKSSPSQVAGELARSLLNEASSGKCISDQEMSIAQATEHNVSGYVIGDFGSIADESVGQSGAVGGLSATVRPGNYGINTSAVSGASATINAYGTDGSKAIGNRMTRSEPKSEQIMNPPDTQAVSSAGGSTDYQSQSGTTAQGQAGPNQTNVVINADRAVPVAQTTAAAYLEQAAPTVANFSGRTTKVHDASTSMASAAPQIAPVINTAKLIQAMGQSEMRVGMRSAEFGNISIITSTTRDAISAQISLDHGELAKALATHLPEIQAKLGGAHAVNVRIDTSAEGAGRDAGTFGGGSNGGSADDSRGGRHHAGSSTTSHPGNGISGRSFPSRAAVTRADSMADSRLDIRV